MEYRKVIRSDKNFHNQIMVIVLLLAGMLLAGELIAARMAKEYKMSIIQRDYAAAGYLVQRGVDKNIAAAAFTSVKDASDINTGALLLSDYGYDEHIRSSLLYEVRQFHLRYALAALFLTLLFSGLIFPFLCLVELRRNKQLEAAANELRRFMEGNTAVRLDDCGEGSLCRLFAAFNAMATSLTAHIERETQNKEFLKDTLSDISHQLKTPLAALQMYNEIILDEKTGNETVESFAVKSRRELTRMEKLIQNLLKLTRLDAGTIELERSVRNAGVFLEECMAPFTTRAEQEGKAVILRCAGSVSLYIDETWLFEAVGNVIKNALDHTAAGGRIDLLCEETAVATEIIIRDNGTGIRPEDIHHIFKRFYRSRYTKDSQGVGIGLALSKAIVEKHGGTITVQSEFGRGAEFRLLFPKLVN